MMQLVRHAAHSHDRPRPLTILVPVVIHVYAEWQHNCWAGGGVEGGWVAHHRSPEQ